MTATAAILPIPITVDMGDMVAATADMAVAMEALSTDFLMDQDTVTDPASATV